MLEEWVRSEKVYEGRIFNVRVGEARLDDGLIAPREIVEHTGGVGIVPVVDGTVILVKQFRIAVGMEIIEVPAGRLEEGESPEYRAACELEEETGYRAGRLVKVSECYPSPGFTNQLDHIYLAFDLEPCEARPEFDERIELVRVPLEEIDALLAGNTLRDAKTIIGLRELQVYLERNSA
ncbi:MAG: NUDIX hydrolase [FCB group bacterium]|nr:NUDIX hydrolase [FCB group bacterium]